MYDIDSVLLSRTMPVFLRIVLVLAVCAGVSQAQVQSVNVECGSNTCFVLCQPNIQCPEDLSAYIDQAHNKLSISDQSLTTEAVVTFVTPQSIDQVVQCVQGIAASNISIRGIMGDGNEVIAAFPLNLEEPDSTLAPDTTMGVVSLRLTSDMVSLAMLAQNASVLCVDVGAIDLLGNYPNAMIIVLEDLYQLSSMPTPAGKLSDGALPEEYALSQNYPNPFNPVTEISFSLPEAGSVKLEVFNLLGQSVATVFEGRLEAGTHSYSWDGSSLASGMYLYRLMAGDFVETKKMILLK